MIFEPKTDFSERDISLDTLNEERRFWAKEGDSKSREFVLRGLYHLYILGTLLDLRKIPRSQDESARAKTVLSEGEVPEGT
ncbi:hypothetical protein HYS01_03340 [Candidatus Saccharibacteria bacterium]|nr:hypothetical protein [Candidatus Saccharibacteria bacterium]